MRTCTFVFCLLSVLAPANAATVEWAVRAKVVDIQTGSAVGTAYGQFSYTFDQITGFEGVSNVDIVAAGRQFTFGERKFSPNLFYFFDEEHADYTGLEYLGLSSYDRNLATDDPEPIPLTYPFVSGPWAGGAGIATCYSSDCRISLSGNLFLSGVIYATSVDANSQGVIAARINGAESPDGMPILATSSGGNGDPIGQVSSVSGEVYITRADGTLERAEVGALIYFGDTVETSDAAAADVGFTDGSSYTVPENVRIEIDEYVYDPAPDESSLAPLRRVFLWTSGLVGGADADNDGPTAGTGCCGIRGDAGELIEKAREAGFGEAGVVMETASPVGLLILANIASGASELTFSYSLLSAAGTFSVFLGSELLFAVEAMDQLVGSAWTETITLNSSGPAFQGDLRFVFDGTAGNMVALWNMSLGDTILNDFANYGRIGTGPIESVYFLSDAQLERVESGEPPPPAPVPLPFSGILLLGALTAIAGLRARSRESRVVI